MPVDTPDNSDVELSVVTTLYGSQPYLREFCDRVRAEAEKITRDYEIILVNDGSPDDSLETALSLQQENPRITVVDLSRNFGQHKAMMAGLEHARGKRLFLIDCDLEEPPECLGRFSRTMESTGADVVYGVQAERKGSLDRRLAGTLFYAIFRQLADYPIPANPLTARLMTRRYVNSLLEHREREVYMAGLWAITGYEQAPVELTKQFKGSSAYSFRRKLAMAVDAVVSFSNRPLAFIFYLGALIMLVSGTAAAVLVVRRIFFNVYLSGWPSLIVSIWLLGGMTIFCLGIIGIYLSKIFIETKHRPYTIVRQVYRSAEPLQTDHCLPVDRPAVVPAPHQLVASSVRRTGR